jgi:RNA polymerase sigma factor (sigma-70 family)
VVEIIFEQSYSASSHVAGVRAAKVAALYGLPNDDRQDLKQEALLELWRKAPVFDEERASWRTFSERVVANRLASLLRHAHSTRTGYGKQDPIEGLEFADVARSHNIDLQTDVRRVLDGVSPFDRTVALSLIDYSAIETSHRLCVSRSTVYRSIGRLRSAFTAAGFERHGGGRARCTNHRQEARS